MRKCPVCGNPMEDDELFCAACGAKYVEPSPAPADAPAPAFCRSCGERLLPDAVFCPNCGANVQSGAAPAEPVTPEAYADLDTGDTGTAKGKKKSKGLLIGIIGGAVGLAAILVVLIIVLVNTVFTSPAKKFVKYQKELVMDKGFGFVIDAADAYNGATEFSTDMTITADCRDSLVRSILRDSSVTLKVNMGRDSVLANGTLNVMGSQALSGTLTFDDGKIGFCVPEADPTYYVADLEKLAYKMGGMYPGDLDGLSSIELPKIPSSTLKKLGNTYFDILASAATEDNVTKSDKNRIRLDELHQTMTGDVYIFEPRATDIEDMITRLAEQLETDKELRSFISELVGKNSEFLEQAGDVDLAGDFDEALVDLAKELKDNARDIGRSVQRSGLVWTVGVVDGEACLNKIELDNGNTVVALERADGKLVLYTSSYGSVDGRIQVNYEKNGSLYDGSLVVSDRYDDVVVSFEDLNLDKKSVLNMPYGRFSITADDETVTLEVSESSQGGTDHTITLPEFYLSGYGYLSEPEINIHTTDKKSTASKPREKSVDVSSYSQEELEDILEDIGYDLSRVLMELGGDLMYNSYGGGYGGGNDAPASQAPAENVW